MIACITAACGKDQVFCQMCPSGWSLYDGSCYKLYTDAKTYYEAQQVCKQMDGDLAMAKTTPVNDLLARLLTSEGVNAALLGLHDLATEQAFYWVDGTALTASTSHWNPGEPNDYSGEDCVTVLSSGGWNDISCTNTLSYLCERSNELPLACDEGSSWYGVAGKCFKFFGFTRTWINADNYCRGVGGTLVVIGSDEEQAMVANRVSVSKANVWLGLSDTVGGAAGNYKWSTGESLTYTKWDTDQPDDRYYTAGGDCVEITQSATDGKWSTAACTNAKKFMCERPEGSCPAGWHLYSGSCYQFNIQLPTIWKTAKFTCEAQGAYLLTSLSSAENAYIVDKMVDYHDIAVESSWLGLSDTETDGSFVWVEGSSLSYSNWDTKQPTNRAGSEDCIYITTGDGTGKWSSTDCESTNAYICKIKADIPISILDPAVGVHTCDDGWTLNGDSCFYFDRTARYYKDADTNCQTLGGFLTSIHSQTEQNFLSMRARMGGAYLWIGFHDYNTENVFAWADGSEVDFYNWASGQPDNWKSKEDAVHMRSNELDAGKWNDIDGDVSKLASVCKKPSKAGTIVIPPVIPTPVFDPRCGNGWDYDVTGQNCYLFRYSDYMSWADAREYCQVQGGDLASIASKEEQTYMNGRLSSIENDMWIGGTDFTNEGGWEWTDGSGFSYLNWAPNEPNNVGDSEHCMEIFTKTDTWNDNKCDIERGFICKKNGYLTTHFLVTPHAYMNGPGQLVLSGVYPDECASRCVKMTDFICKSFNYNRVSHECSFNDGSTTTPISDGNMDYYERLMDVRDPEVTTLGPGYRCPEGWSGYGNNCYYMYTLTKLSFSDVQQKCKDLGGDLASIHDLNENSFILALARDNGMDNEFWIGLNDGNSPMSFQWEDETPVDFTLWNTDEPNNYAGTAEDCVEMYMFGYWNDNLCSVKQHGACKRPKENLGPTLEPITPSGCSLGDIANGGSCYFVMDTPKNWADARADCAGFSPRGNLVSIADRYEQSVLTSILGSQDGSLFWTGLSDVENPGQYSWSDNTAVTLTNWDYAQPDDTKGNCVASTSGMMAGLWRNIDCASTNKYLCERGRGGYSAPQTIGPTTLATAPSDVGCHDSNWKGYGANCYMIVLSDVSGATRRNWDDARMYCLAMGADLASFHSQAEEDYILSGYPDSTASLYVGLHDQSEEGGFTWTDGTPVEHTNWNTGEPNNWGPGEDCTEVFLNGRKWNDIYCTNLNDWICKISKNTQPVYTTVAPSTVTPYPPCLDNQDWILYPQNNYCYFFSQGLSQDAGLKSWMNANEYCMQSGGYLASIHSQEENDFLKNYMVRFGEVEDRKYSWIGLREYTTEGVFSWSDGSAVDYTSWTSGEPNDYNGEEQCAEYYSGGTWNDANCAKETVFVCRKPYGNIGPVTHPPTLSPIGNCQTGWLRFDNRCYKIYGLDDAAQRMSWFDARDTCKNIANTNLVTVHSHELQAYLTSKLVKTEIAMWIGLSDSIVSGKFYWTDGSSVDYTYWNPGEPNNFGSGEDCTQITAIDTHAGKWNDISCDAVLGFICQGVLDPNGSPPPDEPNECRDGFTQFDTGCYQVVDRPYIFSEAQDECRSLGDDVSLSSVMSWYEEAFAETMSHTSSGDPLWIGLYQVEGAFKWMDAWPVWFTAWGPSEPSGAPGEGCISLLPTGGWDDTNCQGLFKPLCKYSTITTPTVHPEMPGYCPEEWTPYHDGCYKVYAQQTDRKSWPEAQFQCSQLNGTLASIHTRQELEIIRTLMVDGSVDIWSGLRRETAGGFVWEDETPVDYTNWNTGEPTYATQPGYEDCVEMYLSTGKWNDVDCLNNQGYVCEQPKLGGGVRPKSTLGPSTVTPWPQCPTDPDWVLFQSYCYFFSGGLTGSDARMGWGDANSYCMERGGYLVSLHSTNENNFLQSMLTRYADSNDWIGLRTYSGTGFYQWSDSSPLDFQAWNVTEPNDANGEEECAEFYQDGSWNDLNCGDKLTFVCKKAVSSIMPVTHAPTPVPDGNCPSGTMRFDNMCYRMIGANSADRNTWYNARDICRNSYNGDLATIHSQALQSFFTTQMKDIDYQMYIGLSDSLNNGQFRWTDGTSVDFTNWNIDEPNDHNGDEDCVEMVETPERAGKWNDQSCNDYNAFICQTSLDLNAAVPPSPPSSCRNGFSQYGDSCFKVVPRVMSYSDAIQSCRNEGSDTNLASIIDVYENAFAETMLHYNGDVMLWLGLLDDKASGQYKWVDSHPVWFTNWAQGEPSQGGGEGCTAIGLGGWDDHSCTDQLGALCKYSLVPIPTNHPDVPGTCPDSWVSYGSNCYLFSSAATERLSWPSAEYICRQGGGHMASIHSKQENEWIRSRLVQELTDVWIGFEATPSTAFAWTDDTLVDYTNWNPGEPNSNFLGDEDCAEMYLETGKWNDLDCLSLQGYVCKTPKTPLSGQPTQGPPKTLAPGQTTKAQGPGGNTIDTPTNSAPISSGVSTGAIAGIVIAAVLIICVTGLLVFFLYSSKNKAPMKTPEIPYSTGFENVVYNEKDGTELSAFETNA